MTPNEEKLIQFLREYNDPCVWAALLDMVRRAAAGESMESIAASYGISLEGINA